MTNKIFYLGTEKELTRNWLIDKKFLSSTTKLFSDVFNMDINLSFFTLSKALASPTGNILLKNVNLWIKKIFIPRKERSYMKIGFFFLHLSLFFKAPFLLVNYLTESIEYRIKHYSFLYPFRSILKLINLKSYNLYGIKLGFYGRLNGRDRKFRYFITKGIKPLLGSTDFSVDYAQQQSITKFGIVHIHFWMYK